MLRDAKDKCLTMIVSIRNWNFIRNKSQTAYPGQTTRLLSFLWNTVYVDTLTLKRIGAQKCYWSLVLNVTWKQSLLTVVSWEPTFVTILNKVFHLVLQALLTPTVSVSSWRLPTNWTLVVCVQQKGSFSFRICLAGQGHKRVLLFAFPMYSSIKLYLKFSTYPAQTALLLWKSSKNVYIAKPSVFISIIERSKEMEQQPLLCC